MNFSRNNFRYILLSFFLFLASCQGQKENKDDYLAESYDSLEASITITKSYIRKLDSALLKASLLEELLNESDSAKRMLRTYDQDMVRTHEIDKPPLLDTLNNHPDIILKEANLVLGKAKDAIETTKEQIEVKKNQYNLGDTDPEREITQEYHAQIKISEEIISEAEKEAQKLQEEINKISNKNRQ